MSRRTCSRKCEADLQDVEGFIEYPRSLRTAKVAVFLKEGQHGQISVSLRAKGECDVAEIAKLFNGGGHRNAAGFRFNGKNLEQVRSEVMERRGSGTCREKRLRVASD